MAANEKLYDARGRAKNFADHLVPGALANGWSRTRPTPTGWGFPMAKTKMEHEDRGSLWAKEGEVPALVDAGWEPTDETAPDDVPAVPVAMIREAIADALRDAREAAPESTPPELEAPAGDVPPAPTSTSTTTIVAVAAGALGLGAALAALVR